MEKIINILKDFILIAHQWDNNIIGNNKEMIEKLEIVTKEMEKELERIRKEQAIL